MLTPRWLISGPVARVLRVLEEAGFEAHVVGGAVRNALLGREAKDFDIATSARPDEVTDAFYAIARVVPTGADHGTVTVVIDGAPIEVTTFRRDVSTDGRRATVAFSDSLVEDAERRDFTMNALYLDRHGKLTDPTGGAGDIRKGRLRFIGDAASRISEDYLRSLRYFRLFAEYLDPKAGLDPDALSAIADNLDGVPRLSVERVTAEITRMLSAPDPTVAVAGMEKTGLLAVVLPGAVTPAFFELLHLEAQAGRPPDPIRRLAALTPRHELRLSRKDAGRFDLLSGLRGDAAGLAEIAWRHGADTAWDTALLRAAGMSQPMQNEIGREIEKGAQASLPIKAADLMPDLQGERLGQGLKRATDAWIESDFTLGRDALVKIARAEG